MKDFKCDRCSRDLEIHEVGFMGNPDGDEGCHEFTEIVTFCNVCNTRNTSDEINDIAHLYGNRRMWISVGFMVVLAVMLFVLTLIC